MCILCRILTALKCYYYKAIYVYMQSILVNSLHTHKISLTYCPASAGCSTAPSCCRQKDNTLQPRTDLYFISNSSGIYMYLLEKHFLSNEIHLSLFLLSGRFQTVNNFVAAQQCYSTVCFFISLLSFK